MYGIYDGMGNSEGISALFYERFELKRFTCLFLELLEREQFSLEPFQEMRTLQCTYLQNSEM